MAYQRRKKKTVRQFIKDNLPKIIVIAIMVLLFIAVLVYRICADAKWNDVASNTDVKANVTTIKTVEAKAGLAESSSYTGDIKYNHTKYPNTTVVTDDPRVYIIAQLIWGEARGVQSTTEQAAVAWCVLNRVDDPQFPDTIEGVITQEYQFEGYDCDNPAEEEFIFLAADVIHRWQEEKKGHQNVGRILPNDYVYFEGDGERNWFSAEWLSSMKTSLRQSFAVSVALDPVCIKCRKNLGMCEAKCESFWKRNEQLLLSRRARRRSKR